MARLKEKYINEVVPGYAWRSSITLIVMANSETG